VARREPAEKVVFRVGRRVAEIRRHLGWTQEQLAERLGRHSVQWISKIEGGGVNLTLHTMVKLARVLDVEVADLLVPPAPEPARRPRKDAGKPRAKRTSRRGK
jgi:UDP-N-acetylglucosamine 1-carboxyvinyltransferase